MRVILQDGSELDTTDMTNIKLYVEGDTDTKDLVIQLTPTQTNLILATNAMIEELIEVLG